MRIKLKKGNKKTIITPIIGKGYFLILKSTYDKTDVDNTFHQKTFYVYHKKH